jgi:DNA-binding CsgD family transcriptional regulator
MPRLSRAQDQSRRQIDRLASLGLPPDDLARRLLNALAEAIPADGHALWGLDPGSLLFNRVLALSGTMVAHTPPFLRDIYLREPIPGIRHPQLMGAGVTAVVLHERAETSWGLPRAALGAMTSDDYAIAYRTAAGPRGGLQRAFFGWSQEWRVALEIVRYAPEWPFQRSDVAFTRSLARAIGETFRRALAREQAGWFALRAELPPSGVITLAPSGGVLMRTPAADWWLERLRAAEGEGVSALPTAVWAAVAGLQAGRHAAPAMVRAETAAGPLLVEATPGQEDGTVAVILSPQGAAPLPEAPSQWPLTRQERRVVRLTLRGWTDQQIATALNISEHTVGSHLHHVYGKLSVHGRMGLLALYVADSQGPASADPILPIADMNHAGRELRG